MDGLALIAIVAGAAVGAKLTIGCKAPWQHTVTGIGAIGGWLVIDHAPELLGLAPLLHLAMKWRGRGGTG